MGARSALDTFSKRADLRMTRKIGGFQEHNQICFGTSGASGPAPIRKSEPWKMTFEVGCHGGCQGFSNELR